MAPQSAKLESALVDASREVFQTDHVNLTVNAVRKLTEDKLGLEAGFFKEGAWKAKSKDIITSEASKLLDSAEKGDGDDESESRTKLKPEKKKNSREKSPVEDGQATAVQTKLVSRKRKTARTEAADNIEDEEVDEGRKSDEDEEKEAPDVKRKKAKVGAKSGKRRVSASGVKGNGEDSEEDSTEKTADKESDDAAKQNSSEKLATETAVAGVDAGMESDGSSTSVLADTPPPKRRGKMSKASKPSKEAKSSSKQISKTADSSPDEAEVKKLQGQLLKCGVRKIWGIELKQYGGDTKAKVRHLREMLRDVGMVGRFSEARAREIKEQRELMADLEDVQEMNRNWGASTSGRPSRKRTVNENLKSEKSGTKSTKKARSKISDDDDERDGDNVEDAEDSDEAEDVVPQVAARSRQSARQADLAFLGSESDSE